MVELELAALLPFIGICLTGGIIPLIVKKMDLGKSAKNHLAEKLDQIEERLRQAELKLARLERNGG